MQPQTPQINPYGAPQAPVADHVGDQAILEHARSVPAGHALSWFREAWRLFKVSPGVWIGLWVVFVLILLVIGLVPILGGIAAGLLTPVFVGGAMIAARGAEREGTVRFGDLFACFSGRTGPLLLIGLLQMALSVAVTIAFALAAVVFIGATIGMSMAEMAPEEFLGSSAMILLVVMGLVLALVFVPVTNAVWLASCLAALHDMSATEALRRGFGATFRNLLPLLLLVLIGMLLAVLASIPLALGWLVLGPVLLCVLYAQYRDLFDAVEPSAQTSA